MKFSVEKYDLLDAVKTTIKAVSQKTSIEALEGLLITAENNKLELCGYNLSLGIQTQIPAFTDAQGKVLVKARLLLDILNNASDANPTVFFELDEVSNVISLQVGKAKYSLAAMKVEDYPNLPAVDISESSPIMVPQHKLSRMINQTLYAVSDNPAKPVLTGCSFEIKDQQLTVAAVDGYRLSVSSTMLDDPTENDSFVVPAQTLKEILRTIDGNAENPAEIYRSANYALIKIDEITFISRLLDGEFLNYRNSIPADLPSKITIPTQDLKDSITRVALMSTEKRHEPVRLTFEDSTIKLACMTAVGKSYDELSYEGYAENCTIGLNSRFLLDALRTCKDETISASFGTSLKPIIFTPVEDPEDGISYFHMVLPVRLK